MATHTTFIVNPRTSFSSVGLNSGRDTDMTLVSAPVFGVNEFNGVIRNFVRRTVPLEIKMADWKMEKNEHRAKSI